MGAEQKNRWGARAQGINC